MAWQNAEFIAHMRVPAESFAVKRTQQTRDHLDGHPKMKISAALIAIVILSALTAQQPAPGSIQES